MNKFIKGKFGTVLILFATLILAGVAIFTAFRLYQLRQTTVAPNAPSSVPKADTINNCQISFTLSTKTASPTGTGTTSPTSTATASPTTYPSGSPNSCGGTCGSDANCMSGYYICYQGFCRDRSCPTKTDCTCGITASPTSTTRVSGTGAPAPTEAALPQSGTNWPTLVGTGLGIFVILGAILLAL